MEFIDQSQSAMVFPAAYAILSEEEMTYVEGGAFSIDISPEKVAQFAVNFTVNLTLVFGQLMVESALNGFQVGTEHGLSVFGVIEHFWNRQNTASKILAVGASAIAGVYIYSQVLYFYRTIKSLIDIIQDVQLQTAADANAAAAAA